MSFYMVDLYIHSLKIPNYLNSRLIKLSASNEVSMQFQEILRNDTQVFLRFKIPILVICIYPVNFTPYILTSSTLARNAGTSKAIALHESKLSLPATPITF